MSSTGRSIAIIGVLFATQVVGSCARNQPAPTAAGAAGSQKDVPPATVYADHIWAGGMPPPGGVASNSQAPTEQSLKDGAALFSAMNCDGCHSSDGGGYVGPSLADGRWRYGGRDEEIFNSIFYGRPKGMPAYGGLLGQGGVWLLVPYVKSFPKPDSVPTLSAAEPKAGQEGPGPQTTAGAATQ